MIDPFVIATPVIMLLIVSLLGFTGCGQHLGLSPEPEASKDPRDKFPPRSGFELDPDMIDPNSPPPPPATYQEAVVQTKGIAAYWPLNETAGNQATALGLLSATAYGVYRNAQGPTSTGYTLGQPGALQPKEMSDRAPAFLGSTAFIDVAFHDAFNPGPGPMIGFSVELWVKPDPAVGPERHVLVSSHHVGSATLQMGYEIGLWRVAGQQHQRVYGRVFASTGQTMTEVFAQPTAGAPTDWRHVVFTYETPATGSPTIRISVRVKGQPGNFVGLPTTANYQRVSSMNTSTLRFGARHIGAQAPEAYFTGLIDNIAFYNAPLSDTDIDAHFKFG